MNSKKFQIISKTVSQRFQYRYQCNRKCNTTEDPTLTLKNVCGVKDGTFFHLLFTIFESILQVAAADAGLLHFVALLLILHPAKKDAIFC